MTASQVRLQTVSAPVSNRMVVAYLFAEFGRRVLFIGAWGFR